MQNAPSRRPRLDVIIVSWNSGSCLDRCLASLGAASRLGFNLERVVVVDNASDPPVEATIDRRPREALPLTIVTNVRNRGFAAACTQGAVGSRADYLLFLNPDTHVGVESLTAAVAALEAPEAHETAILGLPLIDDHGVPQPTCGRFLSIRRVFNQVTGLSLLASPRFEGIQMIDWPHRETRAVDYVSGACLFVRRPVFEALRGFDARFVVYLEDADLALRARRLGWSTVFLAGPPVYHEHGWGTGAARSLRLAHAWRSLVAYARIHLGVGGLCAVAAMVFGVAPVARLGQAAVHRSVREMGEALVAYGRLWRLMFQRTADETAKAPGQTVTANSDPARDAAAPATFHG